MRYYILIFLFVVGCNKEPVGNVEKDLDSASSRLIRINEYYCSFDIAEGIMLFPIDHSSVNEFIGIVEYSEEHYGSLYINGAMVNNGDSFNFGEINVSDTVGVTFKIDSDEFKYDLLFTTLPTVLIFTEDEIVNEPKILSQVIVNDLLENNMHQVYSGIEIRGCTSRRFPKVSYDLELWADKNGSDTFKETFLRLRNGDDWHLDAMYIDLSKSRNILGMELWSLFARAQYLAEEDRAQLSQRGHLVEVFLNNRYLGIYSLNEQIDRKQLRLKKNGGILYKSFAWNPETLFEGIEEEPNPTLKWRGYEIKHPELMDVDNWEPLYNLIDLVAYSDDHTFINSIYEHIDYKNVVDYYLLINMIQASDNFGKNMFLCRYDRGYPLFFVPWDLDLAFGNKNSKYTENDPNDLILTNQLFDRLYQLDVNSYRNDVKLRWQEIYQTTFSKNFMDIAGANINKIIVANADVRDNKRWNLTTDYNVELEYLKTWLSDRFTFLDEYITANY